MPDGPPDAPSPAAPTESPPTPRESRLAAQRRVLTKEFDLEIYIKRCEAQAIQEELEKGEKLLSRLKDVLLGTGDPLPLSPVRAPSPPRPIEQIDLDTPEPEPEPQPASPSPSAPQSPDPIVASPASPNPHESLPFPTITSPSSITPLKTEGVAGEVAGTENSATGERSDRKRRASRRPTNEGLHALRGDGVYVKIICPGCSRSDFSNLQGFVNHTRISHQLNFLTHPDAVDQCGVVDPDYLPPKRGVFESPQKKRKEDKELAPHPPIVYGQSKGSASGTGTPARTAVPVEVEVESYDEASDDEEEEQQFIKRGVDTTDDEGIIG